MKRALWLALCLCMLCACAYADNTQNETPDAVSIIAQRQQEEGGSLRHLRQEADGVKAAVSPQQLTDKDSDDERQPKPDALEKPLEKSTGRPIRRVYDPISGLFCELVGECHACPVSEKDEVYCRETGNRQEMRCPRAPENKAPADDEPANANSLLTEIRFKACVPEEQANPFLNVLLFEFIMAGSLAGAFVLLRREQQKHMSLFDLRKDPRQRGSLLGSGGGQKGAD